MRMKMRTTIKKPSKGVTVQTEQQGDKERLRKIIAAKVKGQIKRK